MTRGITDPEERKAYDREFLKQHPYLTQEILDEWDKVGRSWTPEDTEKMKKYGTLRDNPEEPSPLWIGSELQD